MKRFITPLIFAALSLGLSISPAHANGSNNTSQISISETIWKNSLHGTYVSLPSLKLKSKGGAVLFVLKGVYGDRVKLMLPPTHTLAQNQPDPLSDKQLRFGRLPIWHSFDGQEYKPVLWFGLEENSNVVKITAKHQIEPLIAKFKAGKAFSVGYVSNQQSYVEEFSLMGFSAMFERLPESEF